MKFVKLQLQKILMRLDIIAAFFVLFLAMLLSLRAGIKQQFEFTLGGVLSFTTASGYLCVRNRLFAFPEERESPAGNDIRLLLNILFFGLLGFSILIFYLRTDLYVRPLDYFIAVSLMAVLIMAEIVISPPGKFGKYSIILKIILLGLSLEFSQALLYPSVLGNDPWVHQAFTETLLNTGRIPEGSQYTHLPFMPLEVAQFLLVTGLDYKLGALLSISVLQVVVDALFAFLLGKKLFGVKAGFIASLLLVTANHHVYMGFIGIPNTLGATLILPVIYVLMIKVQRGDSNLFRFIAYGLMAALILTHSVSTLALLFILFVMWISGYSYNKIQSITGTPAVEGKTVLFFLLAVSGYWTFVSGHTYLLIEGIQNILGSISFEVNPLPLLVNPSISEQIFAYAGILMFFALSFFGLFFMISRYGHSDSFVLAMAAVSVFGIAAFSLITNTSGSTLGDRWLYFAVIMLALPVSLMVTALHDTFKARWISSFAPCLLVGFLVFFMIVSPEANHDNRAFNSNLLRYSMVTSEIRGYETLLDKSPGTLMTDWYAYNTMSLYFGQPPGKFMPLDDNLKTKSFDGTEGKLIIVRKEVSQRPVQIKQGILDLDYDPESLLLEDGFSRVYDSCGLTGYIKN